MYSHVIQRTLSNFKGHLFTVIKNKMSLKNFAITSNWYWTLDKRMNRYYSPFNIHISWTLLHCKQGLLMIQNIHFCVVIILFTLILQRPWRRIKEELAFSCVLVKMRLKSIPNLWKPLWSLQGQHISLTIWKW